MHPLGMGIGPQNDGLTAERKNMRKNLNKG
jgi:hypothetical protein